MGHLSRQRSDSLRRGSTKANIEALSADKVCVRRTKAAEAAYAPRLRTQLVDGSSLVDTTFGCLPHHRGWQHRNQRAKGPKRCLDLKAPATPTSRKKPAPSRLMRTDRHGIHRDAGAGSRLTLARSRQHRQNQSPVRDSQEIGPAIGAPWQLPDSIPRLPLTTFST